VRLADTLSLDERIRAQQFRSQREKNRFIARRGFLRLIVGLYLNLDPDSIALNAPAGRPVAIQQGCGQGLRISMSHSVELALYAPTPNRRIGVDIEHIRPITDADQIAEFFFSPREYSVFRRLPRKTKNQAFFECWTRKEAFIEACGTGLQHPLDDFDVSFAPDRPAKLLKIRGDRREASKWCLS